MEALASDARQVDDEQLFAFATRIKARAIQRSSEIIRAFPPAKPGPSPVVKKIKDGTVLELPTQREVATDAGLSDRQFKTTMRVGSVPRETFEKLVESEKPPTITKLAEVGNKSQP
jgi:hypothetical protein